MTDDRRVSSGFNPNFTQTPNLYFDRVFPFLEENELKTLLYATRRVYGWSRDVGPKGISLTEFCEGRVVNGRRVDYGTQLSRPAQKKALDGLERFGLMVLVQQGSGRTPDTWDVETDEARIDFDAIMERHEAKRAKGRKRTKKATKKSMVARAASKAEDPPDPEPEGEQNPVAVRGTYQSSGTWDVPEDDSSGTWDVPDSGTWDVPDSGTSDVPVSYIEKKKEKKPRNKREQERLEIAWGMLVHYLDKDQGRAAEVWQAQLAFREATKRQFWLNTDRGLEELGRDWWPYLDTLVQEAGGSENFEAFLPDIVAEMDERKLTLATPKSIAKVGSAVISRKLREQSKKAKTVNGDGAAAARPMSQWGA